MIGNINQGAIMSHTKLPWKVKYIRGIPFISEGSDYVFNVAMVKAPGYSEDGKEATEQDNADFIVKACNAHEALVRIAEMLSKFDCKEGLSPEALTVLHNRSVAALNEIEKVKSCT
jgi:hypothetical protein